jgi:thymidylate synthase ThyX
MKVTHVAICPTDASQQADRPSLTPELLAASGARYSRNNEGLDSILSKIDPNNLDNSVDGIFRMIDYGHQSIADMAPVALFMDGLSLWLAYYIWTLSPTAGGQESSTRYINYAAGSAESTLEAQATRFGIPATLRDEWKTQVRASFAAYESALQIWSDIAEREPDVARIPRSLQEDHSEKAQKQVTRMRRNYAFDRARNFLPSCAPTNVMMVMSARGWVNLCQHLLSHPNPEAQQLGELVREEMAFSAPRLLRHAVAKTSIEQGLRDELRHIQTQAAFPSKYLQPHAEVHEHPPGAFLELFPSRDFTPAQFTHDLQYHDNRYAWLGAQLRRTALRFGWEAVAFAEIRDLNRHRTGTKWCPFVPQGFYAALDQIPANTAPEIVAQLHDQSTSGRNGAARARALLAAGDPTYVYWTALGTQVPFEHTTTADKFIYEAELRTGTGAHFRYASHLRDVLALWYQQFPQTRGLVLEGSAEPE